MSEKYIGNVAEVTSLDDVANFLIESTSQSIKKIPTETLKEGIYKDLPIDSEFSDTSENAVKNKVIYKALEYKADVIINSASGTTVTTTDSAKVKPKNIKLFGKGKQRQYEGHQLFDAKTAFATQIEAGIIAVNDDGSVTLNGTFNSTNRSFSITLQAGTYYFTESKNILHHFARGSDVNWNNSVVLEEETTFSGYINNDTYNNVTISPIIATSSDVELEPYVGNEPSPSMNYPQIPEFLGESGSIGGKVLGKNIWNKEYAGDVNNWLNSSGYLFMPVKVITGVPVSVSYTNSLTTGLGFVSRITDNVGNINKGYSWLYHNSVQNLIDNNSTLTPTSDVIYIATTIANFKAFIDNIGNDLQIEYGNAKTERVEYTEQPFTALTPNGLRGIPLGQTIPDAIKNSPIHMSGVYWDSVEQQYYIGDTKNENGKDVQRVLKVTIDGNSNVFDYHKPLDTSNIFGFPINGIVKGTQVLCDKLTNRGVWNNDINGIWVGANNAISIRLNNNLTGITTEDTSSQKVAKVKELLTNNPIEIYYWSIIDPIITGTTEEEKAQLDALVMNYPNTTIVNDAGAYQEVTYIADTKNYIAKIEKKHEEDIQTLKNAILSLGGNV